MKCFYCQKEILSSEEKMMIGFDKPYLNVFIHRYGCFQVMKEVGENEYMNANSERLYELATLSPLVTSKKQNVKRK